MDNSISDTENKSRKALAALFNKASEVFTNAKVRFQKDNANYVGVVVGKIASVSSSFTSFAAGFISKVSVDAAVTNGAGLDANVSDFSNIIFVFSGLASELECDSKIIKDFEQLDEVLKQVKSNDNILDLDDPTLAAIEAFTNG